MTRSIGFLLGVATVALVLVNSAITPAPAQRAQEPGGGDIVDLVTAVQQRRVVATVRSHAGASGDIVEIHIRRLPPTVNGWPRVQVVKDLGVKGLRVTVRPGRVFKNSQATRQDVVAQELVGELATPGANRFKPTDLMVLNDYNTHYFLVRVFCLQFRRDMLGEGLSMSIAGTAPAAVVLVVRAITSETLPIAQAGISAVTDNITKEELASGGSPLSPGDVERVRTLLLRAGLNPSHYQLTG